MSLSQVHRAIDSKIHESYPRFVMTNLREIHFYRFALFNFVVNNLRMRYRRSMLGFVWSLLNPLLGMVVISAVFSIIFQQDIRTFAIYIFSGLAPWSYLSTVIIGSSQTLINAEGYLKKVYLPKVLFPLVTVTTETVNFAFSLISMCLLALVLGFQFRWTIFLLPFAMLSLFIFNLGWALIFGVFTVYFRDLTQILMVVFQALFYLVPIIYPIESIPERFRILYYWNPLFYYITLFRKVIYGKPALLPSDWIITSAMSFLVIAIGFLVLQKRDRDLIFRL